MNARLLLLALLVSACAPAPYENGSASSEPPDSADLTVDAAYVDTEMRFAVRYPPNWNIEEESTLATETGEYSGTALVVPGTWFSGSTLLDARVHAAVTDNCPTTDTMELATLDGRVFRANSWSDAGAGNLYRGKSYIVREGDTCGVITLQQHLCNLGEDCGPGNTEAFDREDELLAVFDEMAASFVITPNGTAASSLPVACTLEARQCPDGSYVGRTGPNCEFAPCPGEASGTGATVPVD